MTGRRLLFDDPAGTTIRRVSLDVRSDRFTVQVDRADGREVRLDFSLGDRRLEVRRECDGCRSDDLTHDPAGALRSLFDDDPHPGLLGHLIDLAARFSEGARSARADDPSTQLLLAAHPSLGLLVQEARISVPNALPIDISRVFRLTTVRDAVDASVPSGRASRTLRDSVIASWTSGGVLRLRDVSMLRAGVHLPESQLLAALAHTGAIEPWCTVSTRAADDCGLVLARLGRTNHASVFQQIVVHPGGLALIRVIAAAGSAGIDTSGIRGGERLNWLLTRCAEALERPLSGTPIGHWHGRRIGDSGRRVRVVATKPEFAHVASRMSNCLATYGPSAVEGGSSFVVVVNADGTPEQAIEVRGRRFVHWAGPSNCAVSVQERQTVLDALARPGVRTETRRSVPSSVGGRRDATIAQESTGEAEGLSR